MVEAAPGGSPPSVLLVVEQLRRRVPGGIGRYVRSLLDGLVAEGSSEVTLYASRVPGHAVGRIMPIADPLAAWGIPVRTSRLPGRLLTQAWDRGLASTPAGCDLVHSVSLAIPPRRSAGRRVPPKLSRVRVVAGPETASAPPWA